MQLGLDPDSGKTTRDLLENEKSLILSDHALDIHLNHLKQHYYGIFLEEGHRASNSESGIFNKFTNVLSAKCYIVITGTVVQSRVEKFLTILTIVDKKIFKNIKNLKICEKDITDNGIIADLFKAILGKIALRRKPGCLDNSKMPEVDEFLCLF